MPKPRIIIAQVAGSGTAELTVRFLNLNPSILPSALLSAGWEFEAMFVVPNATVASVPGFPTAGADMRN